MDGALYELDRTRYTFEDVRRLLDDVCSRHDGLKRNPERHSDKTVGFTIALDNKDLLSVNCAEVGRYLKVRVESSTKLAQQLDKKLLAGILDDLYHELQQVEKSQS